MRERALARVYTADQVEVGAQALEDQLTADLRVLVEAENNGQVTAMRTFWTTVGTDPAGSTKRRLFAVATYEPTTA